MADRGAGKSHWISDIYSRKLMKHSGKCKLSCRLTSSRDTSAVCDKMIRFQHCGMTPMHSTVKNFLFLEIKSCFLCNLSTYRVFCNDLSDFGSPEWPQKLSMGL